MNIGPCGTSSRDMATVLGYEMRKQKSCSIMFYLCNVLGQRYRGLESFFPAATHRVRHRASRDHQFRTSLPRCVHDGRAKLLHRDQSTDKAKSNTGLSRVIRPQLTVPSLMLVVSCNQKMPELPQMAAVMDE